jgi:hypothetical protein
MIGLLRSIVGLVGVLGVLGAASAQTMRFDAWVVGVPGDASGVYAATDNSSGSMLAFTCPFTDDCHYRLITPNTCVEGEKYPGVLSTNKGAISVTLHCLSIVGWDSNRGGVLGLAPFDNVDLAVREGRDLGIAVPLKNGQFHVSRFSLIGSSAAINYVNGATAKAKESGNVRPTYVPRDSRL